VTCCDASLVHRHNTLACERVYRGTGACRNKLDVSTCMLTYTCFEQLVCRATTLRDLPMLVRWRIASFYTTLTASC
jgi:hypothetical protein